MSDHKGSHQRAGSDYAQRKARARASSTSKRARATKISAPRFRGAIRYSRHPAAGLSCRRHDCRSRSFHNAEDSKTDATMTRHENRPWVIASVWKGAVGTLQTEQGLMVRQEVSNGQKTPSV
jgi:hypothetical protein